MKFRIPASSANLGPGFDCFGIACWNTALIAFGYFGGGLVIGWFG